MKLGTALASSVGDEYRKGLQDWLSVAVGETMARVPIKSGRMLKSLTLDVGGTRSSPTESMPNVSETTVVELSSSDPGWGAIDRGVHLDRNGHRRGSVDAPNGMSVPAVRKADRQSGG